jgi:hypothetical protein
LKTKTLTFNERDHDIIVNSLKERLEDLSLYPKDEDNITDVKYILSYINSVLWNERSINLK